MTEHRGKPPGKTPDEERFDTTGAGKVGQDDRGNMTWEWSDDEELTADDTLGAAQRIQALVDPTLKVEDEDVAGSSPVQSNPKGLTKGYNPYNSGALGKNEWKKKRDLRELSKWIETRKKVRQSGGGGLPDKPDDEQKD